MWGVFIMWKSFKPLTFSLIAFSSSACWLIIIFFSSILLLNNTLRFFHRDIISAATWNTWHVYLHPKLIYCQIRWLRLCCYVWKKAKTANSRGEYNVQTCMNKNKIWNEGDSLDRLISVFFWWIWSVMTPEDPSRPVNAEFGALLNSHRDNMTD